MISKEFCGRIRKMIEEDDLKLALQNLSELLKNSPKLDEAILQSAKLNDLKKQIRLGIIDFQDANLTKNQIRLGILELVGEIEEKIAVPEINFEVDRYAKHISNKNIVSGNISAGGNVNIGDNIQHVTESKTSRNLRLFMLVFVPVLAISAAIMYYQYKQLQKPLSLSVSLTNLTPNPDLPKLNGNITLKYGDKIETLSIEKEALFRGIPANFREEDLSIHFEADGFIKIDTTIVLDTEELTLSVQRDDSYAIIYGVVNEEDNLSPLADVNVSVLDISTTTDRSGKFTLKIPFEKQRKQQRLNVTKEGYLPFDRTEPVIRNEVTRIVLQKIN